MMASIRGLLVTFVLLQYGQINGEFIMAWPEALYNAIVVLLINLL